MATAKKGRGLGLLDRDLLRQCVHCGLCLPTCPTYRALGIEHDSPRGRIRQMVRLAERELTPADDRLRLHTGQCLDCRACETACPSGVRYGQLIEETRAQLRATTFGGFLLRKLLLGAVFGSGALLDGLGLAMRAYQLTGFQSAVRRLGLLARLPRLAAIEALMPRAQGGLLRCGLPKVTPAAGTRRCRVAVLEGCVQAQLFGETNAATVRVLAANGCEVVVPRGQGCCGALHVHSGEKRMAQRLARRNIAAFEASGADYYVVNAAGCGSTLKEYHELLEYDPAWAARARAFVARTRDASELLAEIGLAMSLGEVRAKATYHDACHLAHGQRITAQPRELLARIPGLELVPLPESDTCCGSAGVYNLTHPDLAAEILEWKIDAIQATGADVVVAANPGCIIQLEHGLAKRGLRVEVVHTVDLLDRSLRAAGR